MTLDQPGVVPNARTGGNDYFNAAGESVDPFVQRHECSGCHKTVWLASHRCRA